MLLTSHQTIEKMFIYNFFLMIIFMFFVQQNLSKKKYFFTLGQGIIKTRICIPLTPKLIQDTTKQILSW
jgi:hypothetical protein